MLPHCSAEFHDLLITDLSVLTFYSGSCRFDTFAPPENLELSLRYECDSLRDQTDFDQYIYFCPEEFSSWELSTLCSTGPVSMVYVNTTVYRNPHCAICHIGDSLENTDYIQSYQPYKYNNTFNITGKIYPWSFETYIRLKYSSMQCCGRCDDSEQFCVGIDVNNSQWGETYNPLEKMCQRMPFNNTCDSYNSSLLSSDLELFPVYLDIESICATNIMTSCYSEPMLETTTPLVLNGGGQTSTVAVWDILSPPPNSTFSILELLTVAPDPFNQHSGQSVLIGEIFGPSLGERNGVPPKTTVITRIIVKNITEKFITTTNKSLELCPDGSIKETNISTLSNTNMYERILLSNSGDVQVSVCDACETFNKNMRPGTRNGISPSWDHM